MWKVSTGVATEYRT